MKHKGTKYLESERLVLRPFILNDAETMYNNWASDSDVTRYLMWSAHDSISVSKKVLQEWTDNYKDNSFYQWAIVLKGRLNEPIGSINVFIKHGGLLPETFGGEDTMEERMELLVWYGKSVRKEQGGYGIRSGKARREHGQ